MAVGDDALAAAMKMSFGGAGGYQVADSRSELQDLLNQSPETQFLAKPTPSPSPTPSPGPAKPTQMNLTQLMDHFGVPNPIQSGSSAPARTSMGAFNVAQSPTQIPDWRSSYGWSGLYG